MLAPLVAVGGCAVAICLTPAGAQAATPLPWSYAVGIIRECDDASCSSTTDLTGNPDYGYAKDASNFASVPGAGVAFGSTAAGTGALALPVLKAYSSANIGYTSTAFVEAVQGYKWTGATGIDIAFSGTVDYVGDGLGFVTAGLAITDTSVRDANIGALWAEATGDGTFLTNCSTPGAIGLVNSGRQSAVGANMFGIDTAGATCPNVGSTFHVNPGDEFYVFARLLTFSYFGGEWDASNTFTVDLSSTLSEESRTTIAQYLQPFQPLAVVPEPSSWMMMIAGFGATGWMIRAIRRRPPAGRLSPS